MTAASIHRFGADLLSPRPKCNYRPEESVEVVALARTTIEPSCDGCGEYWTWWSWSRASANPMHFVPLGRTAVADHIAPVQGYPVYALAVTTSA